MSESETNTTNTAVIDDDSPRDVFGDENHVETSEPNDTVTDDKDSRSDGGDQQTKDSERKPEGAFDDALLIRAEDAGFTQEQLNAFGTPEAVTAALEVMESRYPSTDRQPDDRNAGGQRRQEELAQGGADSDPFKIEPFKPQWDADAQDPDVVKAFDGLAEHHNKQITQVNQQMQQIMSVVGEQMAVSREREFDSAISDLGEAFEDVLGKGSSIEMAGSKTYAAREKVSERAQILADGMRANGKRVPPIKQLVREAVLSVFPNKQGQIERGRIATRLRDPKSGRYAARVTNRSTEGRSTGGAKAADEWNKALGM